MFLCGSAFLLFGIWLLLYMLRETKNGYKDELGNGVKLYFSSIGSIVFGCVLMWRFRQ
jgi:ABC-type dipeptide/oligopeptide/nickel transport system permease component